MIGWLQSRDLFKGVTILFRRVELTSRNTLCDIELIKAIEQQ